MSSAIDIQIVSPLNLEKIQNFFKDVSYLETIEFSASFNTRLCMERRLRLPFFDAQTGIAQSGSQLFMDKRQRMPGLRQGQIYTYPAARWRKSRRQYLNRMYNRYPERPFQALRKEHEVLLANNNSSSINGGTTTHLTQIQSQHTRAVSVQTSTPSVVAAPQHVSDFNGISLLDESSSLGAAGGDTSDSKDSQQLQQQLSNRHPRQPLSTSKLSSEWFYDDMDMNDVDSMEEPKSAGDDEYDYDPRYGSKKRRKKPAKKRAKQTLGDGIPSSGTGRKRSNSGRGRNQTFQTNFAFAAVSSSVDNVGVVGIGSSDVIATTESSDPASSNTNNTATAIKSGRKRGTGTRGRRRTKGVAVTNTVNNTNIEDLPRPIVEPPSFDSAAAAVGHAAATFPKYL